jgi:hypothetical protein
MMKAIYCANCGILTAKLEKGSTIHPKAVMLCSACYRGDKKDRDPIEDLLSNGDMDTVNMFKNIFGMK